MKHKKLIIIAAVSVALIIMAVGVSYSYLTSNPSAVVNKIPIGYDEVSIDEDFSPPVEQRENEATTYQKTVKFANTGNTPCYVRVFADFSSASIRNISSFSYDGGTSFYSAELKMQNNYFIKEVSGTNNPNKGWVYITEGSNELLGGYYYYTEPLAVGEETPPLFTDVKTDYSKNSNQKVEQYDVIVYTETVQTVTRDGNSDTSAADRYKTVWQEFISGQGS